MKRPTLGPRTAGNKAIYALKSRTRLKATEPENRHNERHIVKYVQKRCESGIR